MNAAAKGSNAIREARKAAGITRGHLAQLINVVPSTVTQWETHGAFPTPRKAKRLAAQLPGLTLDAIYAGLHV